MAGIVVALGGNALGNTVAEQKRAVEAAARTIVDLAALGKPLVVVHGNGPQVGIISSAMRSASRNGDVPEELPLAECVAMTQGYIGFHLQTAVENELCRRGMKQKVCSMITNILVDPEDAAFCNPTKPLGAFYSECEARKRMEETGDVFREDAGRGWRRVVASPEPQAVVEGDVIRVLIRGGVLTICGGGGGIPVVRRNNRLESVDAVIDKDYAAAMLAETIQAESLLILTGVPGVYIDFNQPGQRILRRLSVSQAQKYCDEGAFPAGSMLPKVRAAMHFARRGGTAIITSLEEAERALKDRQGTWIVPEASATSRR